MSIVLRCEVFRVQREVVSEQCALILSEVTHMLPYCTTKSGILHCTLYTLRFTLCTVKFTTRCAPEACRASQ